MDWLVEPFQLGFMQRALLAGVLAVITTSLVGTWVVLRGITFMGDALAHGVLPGIALAFLWGADVVLGAVVSALVMVLGINLVNRQDRLPEDTGIGLLFVGMLALGVVIVSRARSFATSLESFLFGDILGVGAGDLGVQVVAAAATLVATAALHRPLLALAYSPEKAEVLGLRPRATHLALLALLALAIVSSFRAVGTLLVFGLLVGPPATASLLVRQVPRIMATSVVVGALTTAAGLLISYHYDTAGGATMAGASVAAFFVVLAGRQLASRRRRAPARA